MSKMVWLKYLPHVPGLLEISEGNPVAIQCRNDLCLVQIDESFLPVALSKKCGCCDSVKNCFVRATDEEIKRFLK